MKETENEKYRRLYFECVEHRLTLDEFMALPVPEREGYLDLYESWLSGCEGC